MLLPILFLLAAPYITIDYLPVEKSKINLLIVAITATLLMTIAFVIQYFVSTKLRNAIRIVKSIIVDEKYYKQARKT